MRITLAPARELGEGFSHVNGLHAAQIGLFFSRPCFEVAYGRAFSDSIKN
jgi:hypothetical protein